jgi:hypothetical protein
VVAVPLQDQRPLGLPDQVGTLPALDGVVDEVAGELLEHDADVVVGLRGGLELEDEAIRLYQLFYL